MKGEDSAGDSECQRILDESNHFRRLNLPVESHEPGKVRRAYYGIARSVHPDKNSSRLAQEAFQLLSTAFETLYDIEEQARYLTEIELAENVNVECSSKGGGVGEEEWKEKKKRPHPRADEWKRKKKQKSDATPKWSYARWTDVKAEMERRERLEREFLQSQSVASNEREALRVMRRAQKICRQLDENAGCPPTYINPLWAKLEESDTQRQARLPDGWEKVTVQPKQNGGSKSAVTALAQIKYVYRERTTGETTDSHPIEEIENRLSLARAQSTKNLVNYEEDLRGFISEIQNYLHEEYDYEDLDDEIKDLDT